MAVLFFTLQLKRELSELSELEGAGENLEKMRAECTKVCVQQTYLFYYRDTIAVFVGLRENEKNRKRSRLKICSYHVRYR